MKEPDAQSPIYPAVIGYLRLTRESSGEDFARFCGAIHAAKRLGHDVRLKVINDPTEYNTRGVEVPLDIHAVVEDGPA